MPELGRSPGGGHSNPLQYSCLENPINRGAWWATLHWVAQGWTQLKQLSTHSGTSLIAVCFLLISRAMKNVFISFLAILDLQLLFEERNLPTFSFTRSQKQIFLTEFICISSRTYKDVEIVTK